MILGCLGYWDTDKKGYVFSYEYLILYNVILWKSTIVNTKKRSQMLNFLANLL